MLYARFYAPAVIIDLNRRCDVHWELFFSRCNRALRDEVIFTIFVKFIRESDSRVHNKRRAIMLKSENIISFIS